MPVEYFHRQFKGSVNHPSGIGLALPDKTLLVGSYFGVLDHPPASAPCRHGLVIVRLGYYLPQNNLNLIHHRILFLFHPS